MPETRTSRLEIAAVSDLEMRMTRSFEAPKHLVFEAFTRPEHMRRWWGPRRMETTVCEIDFRVGGAWRFVQRDEDGSEYGFGGEYREISPPDRLSYTFEFDGAPGHISVETIEFSEDEGRTTLVNTARFSSKEERDAMLESGMESGAAESMDRLEELLAELVSA